MIMDGLYMRQMKEAHYHVISKHLSEEEGLEALLVELRNKQRKEAIMKKLRK